MTTNTGSIASSVNDRVSESQITKENASLSFLEAAQQSDTEFDDVRSDFEYFEEALAVKSDAERKIKVEQLVKDGLDINAVKNGKTILDLAIEKKYSPKVIELLINSGSKINTIDSNDCTILHRSVKNKNVKIVMLLLETNKKEVDKFFLAKCLPEFMLVHQIGINAEDKDGFTALDYAQPNSEIYTLLKKYGAKHSKKFLYFCSLNIKELDFNRLKTDNDYCFDILNKALGIKDEYDRIEVIDWLIENGANINVAKNNKTLLSVAAEKGDVEAAVLLIAKGAREGINLQDNNGRTLLINAIVQNKLDYAELLIKHGLDLYAQNNNGLTPFEYAFQNRLTPGKVFYLLKLYTENGNNDKNIQLIKRARSSSGETLLEYFINNKSFNNAQYCINLGANVNQPLDDGSSLLAKAFQNKNIDGIAFLLKNGARVNSDFSSKKRNNNKLYLKVAVGCAVMFSLGMGIAATFTLLKLSSLALAVTIVASLLTVVASISLLILYKKVKSEKRENRIAVNNLALSANLTDAAGNLLEGIAEASALYFEVQKGAKKIAKEIRFRQEFIEARFQSIQKNLANKFGNFQSLKDILRIYSNIPISNSHLLSLSYHLSWEVLQATFRAITDPTFANVILTAIRERRWTEDTQWSEILRNTVPGLVRNQRVMQNIIVPTLTDILKNLSKSKEERKFIIYTLVFIKELVNKTYTDSVRESLPSLNAELADNVNNIAAAVDDLLNCYGAEEVERAKTANKLDYLLGKLNSRKTGQLITHLKQEISSLTGFQGKIKDRNKQSIRELVDYCLDPEPNDASAAKTLLNNILKYINNDRMVTDVNGNLPDTKTTANTIQRHIPEVARLASHG